MLDIRSDFYDIESLKNVFTLCNYVYDKNCIEVYILLDDCLDVPIYKTCPGGLVTDKAMQDFINQRIYAKNGNFNGTVEYYDLSSQAGNDKFMSVFGCLDDEGYTKKRRYPRFMKDTDPDYSDKKYPYLFGYNSDNYDMPMISLYTTETHFYKDTVDPDINAVVQEMVFEPTTARTMREHNDNLFTPQYKESMPSYLRRSHDDGTEGYDNREFRIYKNMKMTGRYLDVAGLNEKQKKVALKRLLGMLGYQILESDKLDTKNAVIHTIDELADLIAYNVSDVVNLQLLFTHNVYSSNFELKKGLLEAYPELVYDRKNPDSYEYDKKKVRKDRLFIDSSSAKLSGRCLCPYDHLHDAPVVSFMYPAAEKAKELGIPQINVLDETRKFFYGLYPNNPELQAEFDKIYFFYKDNIEGKNFNDSVEYMSHQMDVLRPQFIADYKKKNCIPENVALSSVDLSRVQNNINSYIASITHSISDIPKEKDLTIIYFDRNGDPSSCYAVFGIGGIHGAEYNLELYLKDVAAFNDMKRLFNDVQTKYPDPTMLKTIKKWEYIDPKTGTRYTPSAFLKTGSTKTSAAWKNIDDKKPVLFKDKTNKDGEKVGKELNKRYAFTSAADTNHEDFTSYYPNLLIELMAFYNTHLGYDRYNEIFMNKEKYGKLMKDKSKSEEERAHYSILRNGTKLILNSASGAGDANFFTPIRMNNNIIAMRIIGQLFTYRIAQAQTYEGATIPSTNTDGLYSVYEPVKNAEILARESANIHVAIEPEFCRLISKDTNNRMELNASGDIIGASGGSLACYKRPDPQKALSHAAIIDWILCQYLRTADQQSLYEDFDFDKGRQIIQSAAQTFNSVEYLNMFQTMVSSSISSMSYIFGETYNYAATKLKSSVLSDPLNPNCFNENLFDACVASGDVKILQHYNRVFFVGTKDQFDQGLKPVPADAVFLNSVKARVITPVTKNKRKRDNETIIQHNTYALHLLSRFGINKTDIPSSYGNEREAAISKTTGVEPEWLTKIVNCDLYRMTEQERQELIAMLDLDIYLKLAADSYNNNWKNAS